MHVDVVVDLQFGSTGKGLLCGYLAEKNSPDVVVSAFGPNSGHTCIDATGIKHVHSMLPMGILSTKLRCILLGPGSVLDLDLLLSEINANKHYLGNVLVAVHCNAAVVTAEHRRAEQENMRGISSTMRGTGAALAAKIARQTNSLAVASGHTNHQVFSVAKLVSVEEYATLLDSATRLQVEGAQGYSLSIHHGMYPYVTSRDTSVHQLLADCGVPRCHTKNITVYGVARTFPIRVASIPGGFSGPCYEDQHETTFANIGVAEEYTTVTKLPRRVFTYSEKQVSEAIKMNGCDVVFVNFVNYIKEDGIMVDILASIQKHNSVSSILLGYSAATAGIQEYRV